MNKNHKATTNHRQNPNNYNKNIKTIHNQKKTTKLLKNTELQQIPNKFMWIMWIYVICSSKAALTTN